MFPQIKFDVVPRPELVRPLRQVMDDHKISALILCGGNMRLAARQLEVSYTHLRNWCKTERGKR